MYDIGGKQDKSFNQAAFTGLQAAIRDYRIDGKDLEPNADGSNREELVRSLADDGYQLIIGVGFNFEEPMKNVTRDYPNVKFGIIDDDAVTAPNLTNIVFTEEQGWYLVGVAAAKKTKSGKIGYIGGVKTPLLQKFEAGLVAGAKSVNKDVKVEAKYISSPPDFSGFTNPTSAKTISQGMYDRGADVIYVAAGASGNGVFPVAAKQDRLVIGVDSDQYQQVKGDQQKCMLTSMLKRVDLAVYSAIGDFVKGNLKAGVVR